MWKRLWGIRHVRWFVRKWKFTDWLADAEDGLPDPDDPAFGLAVARISQEIDHACDELEAIWKGKA